MSPEFESSRAVRTINGYLVEHQMRHVNVAPFVYRDSSRAVLNGKNQEELANLTEFLDAVISEFGDEDLVLTVDCNADGNVEFALALAALAPFQDEAGPIRLIRARE